ncbi:hypothetical protein [Paraburkholderia sp. LEh10]|jgi:surface antigen|uniref:hypothetical protein n=1 Tax=Paraburkholderia sp. LEh10 TaxID=2821353 RepID=UPI001FD83A5D|nr:hypothetical protein [Paraburkholderia sp. LEh10]
MHTFLGIGVALVACAGCAVPASQPVAQEQFSDNVCQPVVGQAEIDGTMQQISGIACRQPDGTWQIQQGDGMATATIYPVPAYPSYYYDPSYWGPPVAIGIGGSFVFVDHFHHFHHMNHVHWGRPGGGMHGHGVFHGSGGMHGWGGGSAWSSGGMHGGMHGGMGGGRGR